MIDEQCYTSSREKKIYDSEVQAYSFLTDHWLVTFSLEHNYNGTDIRPQGQPLPGDIIVRSMRNMNGKLLKVPYGLTLV